MDMNTGHEHGVAGLPNMLDVLGRPIADVIDLRQWLSAHGVRQ
jgi:hypothetical protein